MTLVELSEAMGVSKTTVAKWIRLGLPRSGKPYSYDLDECKAWHARTIGVGGRGGKRDVDPGQESDGTLSPERLRQLLADPTSQNVTLAEARAARELFSAAKTAAERDKLTGQMLPKADVEAAWSDALVTLNRALDALPATVAPKVVHAAAEAFDREAGGGTFSMADASRKLAQRVRQLVKESVDQTRHAIVQGANAGAA